METVLCLGPSQFPSVLDGSVLRVRSQGLGDAAPGDLVVFKRGAVQVCHRVLDIRGVGGAREFFLKGDSNLDPDGWVSVGRVAGVITSGERFRGFFRTYSVLQYRFSRWLFGSRIFRTLTKKRRGWFPFSVGRRLFYAFTSPWYWVSTWVGSKPRRRKDLLLSFALTPPFTSGWRLTPLSTHYGYSFHYEALFPRDMGALRSLLESMVELRGVSALDAGAGEGRSSRMLVEMGAKVTYLDSCPAMAARARIQLAGTGVKFHVGDVGSFRDSQPFGAVFGFGNLLEFLGDDSRVEQALRHLRGLLSPEGKAFMEVHDLEWWSKTPFWGKPTWTFQECFRSEGRRFVVWQRARQMTEGKTIWEHAVSRGGWRYRHLRTELHLRTPESWRQLGKRAGFGSVEILGGARVASATARGAVLLSFGS